MHIRKLLQDELPIRSRCRISLCSKCWRPATWTFCLSSHNIQTHTDALLGILNGAEKSHRWTQLFINEFAQPWSFDSSNEEKKKKKGNKIVRQFTFGIKSKTPWYTVAPPSWTRSSQLVVKSAACCLGSLDAHLWFCFIVLSPRMFLCGRASAWPVLLLHRDLLDNVNEITVFLSSQAALCGLMAAMSDCAIMCICSAN